MELGQLAEPAEVAAAFIRALGGNDQSAVTFDTQLLALLPDVPVLVVADNCEHVLDAAASAIAALIRHPHVTVLATSREPLAIPGEVAWTVPALDVPVGVSDNVPVTATVVGDVASVALFVDGRPGARGLCALRPRCGLRGPDLSEIGGYPAGD